MADVRFGLRADDDALSRASLAGPWKADIPPDVQNLRLLEFFQAIDPIALFFSISHRHNSA
jgi:hypothetical protein